MANITPYYDANGTLKSFYIRIYKGCDSNGKKIIVRETFPVSPNWNEKTAWKNANKHASEIEALHKKGMISVCKLTVEEYFERIIKQKTDQEEIKEQTLDEYNFLKKRIYAEIGYIKMKDLMVADLKDFYAKLSKEGNRNYKDKAIPKKKFDDLLREKKITRKELSSFSGVALHTVAETVNGKETSEVSAQKISNALGMEMKKLFKIKKADFHKLSKKTILEYHRFIHMVLDEAVRENVLPYNLENNIKCPKKKKPEVNYFSLGQIQVIRNQLQNVPLKWRTITTLFLATGCRRGEIMGLKWDAVDFEAKTLDIHANLLYSPKRGIYFETPKTDASNRVIVLPDEAISVLEEYKRWQSAEKVRLGRDYHDEGMVFARETGEKMNPQSVNDWMKKFGKTCGFHINPHAFRHTVASVLIFSKQMDIVSISRMLGHADASTTMRVYAHLLADANRESAEIISEHIFYVSKYVGKT